MAEETSNQESETKPTGEEITQKESKQASDSERTGSDKLAGWVIGTYLVIHISLLSYLALSAWLAPDWITFAKIIPLPSWYFAILEPAMQAQKFHSFQSIVLATCAASIGGAVFMVRSFYLRYAYGRESAGQEVSYLQNKEIPRYILLPFSSAVLGPVTLGLLLTGSIVFSGFSTGKEIPHFSAVTISFLLGFAYHDTLGLLRDLSRKIFDRSTTEAQKHPH